MHAVDWLWNWENQFGAVGVNAAGNDTADFSNEVAEGRTMLLQLIGCTVLCAKEVGATLGLSRGFLRETA